MEDKRLNRRQYPPTNGSGPIVRNRAPMMLRPNEAPLLGTPQPQIMPSGPGQPHYNPYPPPGYQMPQVPQPGTTTYLFPEHSLMGPQAAQVFNNSFERASPMLPAVFEYNGLKYIDTARVEPKIGKFLEILSVYRVRKPCCTLLKND